MTNQKLCFNSHKIVTLYCNVQEVKTKRLMTSTRIVHPFLNIYYTRLYYSHNTLHFTYIN